MLTGGGVIQEDNSSREWWGNYRGCGVLNSMCQFGQYTYNGVSYTPDVWGSLLLKLSLFLSS